MEQSKDAVASFAENTDTAAFQSQQLLGDIKDLGVQFGTIMLPVLKDLISSVGEVVDWFAALDEEQKQTVIQVAAVAAAIGPLITFIGNATIAIQGMSAALAFLAANPIVAAIAGVAAVTAGVVALGAKANKDRIAALTEEFRDLAVETGVAEENMEEFAEAADLVSGALQRGDYMATFKSVNEQVNQLSANLGLTREQVVAIGLANENLSDNFRDQLQIINTQIKSVQEQKDEFDQIRELKKTGIAQAAEEKKKQEDITGELEKQAALRKKIEDRYQEQWELNKEVIESNKTELQQLEEQIADTEHLANATETYNDDRAKALEILYRRREELVEKETRIEQDAINERLDFLYKFNEDSLELEDERLYDLEHARREDLKRAEELGVDKLEIVEYYENKEQEIRDAIYEEDTKKMEEEHQKKIDIAKEQINTVVSTIIDVGVAGLGEAAGDFSDNISEIEEEIDSINDKYDEQIDALDDLGLTEAQYLSRVNQINDARQEELATQEEELAYQKKAAESLELVKEQIQGFGGALESFIKGDYLGAIIGLVTTVLQPAFDVLGTYMSEEMTDVLIRIGESLGQIGESLAVVLIPIMEILFRVFESVAKVTALVTETLEPFAPLLETVFELLDPIFDILDAFAPLLQLITKFGLLPLYAAAEAVNWALQPVVWLLNQVAKLAGGLERALDSIVDFIEDIGGGVGDFFGDVGDFFGDVGDFFGFDTGGVVTGSGATPIVVNESGQGEMMLSASSAGNALVNDFAQRIGSNIVNSMPMSDSLYGRLSSAQTSANQGTVVNVEGSTGEFVVNLDGRQIAQSTVGYINNRANKTLISKGSIV